MRRGRIVAARVLPGPLGPELTISLTLLGVGALAFGLLGELIEQHPVPRIDAWALGLADGLRTPVLVDLAKIVTMIGTFPATAIAALATATFALDRRRPIDAGALAAGVLLSEIAIHVAKDHYGRPRPPGSLVHAQLSAYPSGHALHSVTYVACAIILVRGVASRAGRAAAVTVALAMVATVCGTRVYLRVHYLTDVLGGVALGVAVWAAVAVVALLGRDRAPS
jgi:undecaprenyl-diphosphatase